MPSCGSLFSLSLTVRLNTRLQNVTLLFAFSSSEGCGGFCGGELELTTGTMTSSTVTHARTLPSVVVDCVAPPVVVPWMTASVMIEHSIDTCRIMSVGLEFFT